MKVSPKPGKPASSFPDSRRTAQASLALEFEGAQSSSQMHGTPYPCKSLAFQYPQSEAYADDMEWEGEGRRDFTLIDGVGAGRELSPVELEVKEPYARRATGAEIDPNAAAFCWSYRFLLYPSSVPRFSLCPCCRHAGFLNANEALSFWLQRGEAKRAGRMQCARRGSRKHRSRGFVSRYVRLAAAHECWLECHTTYDVLDAETGTDLLLDTDLGRILDRLAFETIYHMRA